MPKLCEQVDHTRGLPIEELSGMELAKCWPSLYEQGYELYKLPVYVEDELSVKILKDMLDTLEQHNYLWKLVWWYKNLHQIAVLRKHV